MQGNALIGSDAQLNQVVSEMIGLLVQFPIGQVLPFKNRRNAVR